ncbi:MAG TPA: hypothetical protein VM285_07215 [Polyangia bacterium]|nr:hypothetical protein [Polyangia bacterium]
MQSKITVLCTSCGAGHEVERILVGPEGTPVRCAACQTIFAVYPENDQQLKSAVVWIVRDSDGNTTPFRRLGVLQKMILEGRAAPDNELSRFGESWKPLGEIDGLRDCFTRAVDHDHDRPR